jgi:hypothetical protein
VLPCLEEKVSIFLLEGLNVPPQLSCPLGWENFFKNFVANSSQLLIEPAAKEFNHNLTLSFNEKGKRINLICSGVKPRRFCVLQRSKKSIMCKYGSSEGVPLKCGSMLNK